MQIINSQDTNVILWPKRTQCPNCQAVLEYEELAVYLADEFELDRPGRIGFWIDCPNCKDSIQLSEKRLPESFCKHLLTYPRKTGNKSKVKIVGNDPRMLINQWPKIIRCTNCRSGLSFDIVDVRVGESFSPDGQYFGVEFYITCPECNHHEVLGRKKLPKNLTKTLAQGLFASQKKTNRWKLLHGDKKTWEEEIGSKWLTLTEDQMWSMTGEVFALIEDRIAVVQQKSFGNLKSDIQTRIILWMKKHPNAWPLI